jgi:osmotically inducible lipoprotein OsmB
MSMKKVLLTAGVIGLAATIGGCTPREERIAAGAGIGAATGAVIGGLAGGGRGALAGAAIGGVGGAIVADASRPRYRCWYNSYGQRVCRRVN